MRLQQLAIQILLLHTIFTSAVNLELSDISKCALSCLTQTFSAANCSLFDTSCQCNDQNLVYSTSTCLLKKCPLADSVALGKLRDRLCNRPPESRQRPMLIVNITMGTLSTLAVILRLLSRCLISKKIWLDDHFIFLAMIMNVSSVGTGAWMQLNGLGKHIWYLSLATIPKILRLFYVSESLYLAILTITKISILLFYLRIFPKRGFRIRTYLVLGLVTISGTIILFLQIFQCTPIAYNWNRSIEGGKCLNVNALTYSHAGMTIFQDLVILVLPIPELVLLKMENRQKVGVILVFQVGIFACITSIVRLQSLTKFDGTKTIDPTWDNVNPTIWTSTEVNTAILCSSLPALRPLLKVIYPKSVKSVQRSRLAFERLKLSLTEKAGNTSTPQKPIFVHQGMKNITTNEICHDLRLDLNKSLPPTPVPSMSEDNAYYDRFDHDQKYVTVEQISRLYDQPI